MSEGRRRLAGRLCLIVEAPKEHRIFRVRQAEEALGAGGVEDAALQLERAP